MARRPRQPKPEPLGEILEKLLKKRNIPHTSVNRRLLDLWRRSVGPQIAAQTHADTVRRGVLFVRVSASVWMHQLQFLKEEILCKLQELTSPEEIRSLFFSVGEIPTPPANGHSHSPEAPATLPLAGRDRRMIQESLDSIADPELKDIVARVMAKEISRRRQREKRRGLGK